MRTTNGRETTFQRNLFSSLCTANSALKSNRYSSRHIYNGCSNEYSIQLGIYPFITSICLNIYIFIYTFTITAVLVKTFLCYPCTFGTISFGFLVIRCLFTWLSNTYFSLWDHCAFLTFHITYAYYIFYVYFITNLFIVYCTADPVGSWTQLMGFIVSVLNLNY